jgi:hypothetical protein
MHDPKYPVELVYTESNILIRFILQIATLYNYLHLILCYICILIEIDDHLITLGNLYFLYQMFAPCAYGLGIDTRAGPLGFNFTRVRATISINKITIVTLKVTIVYAFSTFFLAFTILVQSDVDLSCTI